MEKPTQSTWFLIIIMELLWGAVMGLIGLSGWFLGYNFLFILLFLGSLLSILI